MNSIRCPACGVAVALGYARCPKCHAPMPAAGPRGKRDTQQGGGTSAAAAAPRSVPWLVIGVLVLAIGGVVAWAMTRRDAGARSANPDEAAAPLDEPGGEVEDIAPPPPPEAPVRRDPAGAADRLERQERDRPESGIGHAQLRPLAEAARRVAQRVVLHRLVRHPGVVVATYAEDFLGGGSQGRRRLVG